MVSTSFSEYFSWILFELNVHLTSALLPIKRDNIIAGLRGKITSGCAPICSTVAFAIALDKQKPSEASKIKFSPSTLIWMPNSTCLTLGLFGNAGDVALKHFWSPSELVVKCVPVLIG